MNRFFRGDKDRWRRNSGELSYVACKLGRRPWRLSSLARCANSKTRWVSGLARCASSKTRRVSGLHAVRVVKLGGFRGMHAVRVAKLGGFWGLHAVRVVKPGGFRDLHAVRVAKLGGFWGLHAVRVANSGELSYVACKLGRRPWRLLGLARCAGSKNAPSKCPESITRLRTRWIQIRRLALPPHFFVTPDHAERFTATNPELPALLRGRTPRRRCAHRGH